MKKIKAVIFDLDGTIGDTVPLCIKAFRHSIEPLLKETISDSEITATFGPSEEGTIMALIPEYYEKGILDYLHYYEKFHDICPSPFEGMKELLIKLKNNNVRIGMVTGKGKYSTEISLNKFDLKRYFEIIETGVISGPSKPEGLKRVIKKFDEIAIDEMIYVGDAPSDIKASREVGISVASVAWSDGVEQENLVSLNPDKLFDSVSEFSEWIMSRTELN